jgi:altronate dehydratase
MHIVNNQVIFPLEQVAVRLHPQDHVAISKIDLEAGSLLTQTTGNPSPGQLPVQQFIPTGHKVALREIAVGEPVRRYGQVIGFAGQTIQAGEHVHIHNLDNEGLKQEYVFGVDVEPVAIAPEGDRRTFFGFARADGRVGTRNYIAVISTVSCSAHATREIARHFSEERLAAYPQVDGVIALTHKSGCSIRKDGPEYEWLQRVLAGFARHPNIAASILVGLGCEVNQITDLVNNYHLDQESHGHLSTLTIQELGGIRKTVQAGIEIIETLLPQVNDVSRTPQSISELQLALQCGASDGWSGVTANPVVGLVADRVVGQGGTVVLAETPEIYGAEHLLTRRSICPQVGRKLVDKLLWWEAHTRQNGTKIDNNPTPGNKTGGLTTICEKSLGAIAKGGRTPLMAVYDYAETVTTRGFVFMDSPGNDPISVTGKVAGGCNLVLFTTGRGSVFGFKPSPCLKIVSNSETFERMSDDMDVNAGKVLDGVAMEAVADELLDLVIAVASGRPSKSEAQGVGEEEFSPWRPGETV